MFIEVSTKGRWEKKCVWAKYSFCSHAKKCPGCIVGEKQLRLYTEAARFFSTVGIEPLTIVEMNPTGFRTKVKLAVSRNMNRIDIGLYEEHSHRVFSIEQCLLHRDPINQIVAILQKLPLEIVYDGTTGFWNYLQISISRKTKKAQVTFVVKKEPKDRVSKNYFKKLSQHLLAEYPEIFSSMYINYQPKPNNTILGPVFEHLGGDVYIEETIVGVTIPIVPHHFFQANPAMFEYLLNDMLLHMEKSDSVLELYAGVGVISLVLAKQGIRSVAVELSKNSKQIFSLALEKLPKNASKHISFIEQDVEEYECDDPSITCLVVDPPRKGLSDKTVKKICGWKNICKIIYISCHFPSVERNLDVFIRSGFFVHFAKAYRFFPNTEHIETLVVLHRNEQVYIR